MKKIYVLLSVSILILVSSCSPKISTHINKTYSPLDAQQNIVVIELENSEPDKSEELGLVKIGDTGFTTQCSYAIVLDKAKKEARKVGGNAIKIIEHKLPSATGSTCHRIMAKILKVEKIENYTPKSAVAKKEKQVPLDDNYAILNIYRPDGVAVSLNYDLHLGDSVICRVKNKFKTTIRINKEGSNVLWAKTEAKSEVPIDIKMGKTYYLRCGTTMGAVIGRPQLELVDNETGKAAFDNIRIPDFKGYKATRNNGYQHFTLFLNGGYSRHTAKVSNRIPQDLKGYVKKLMSGHHFSGNATYYFTKELGLGLEYNLFKSSNSKNNVGLEDPLGNPIYVDINDDLNISFIGPRVSLRFLNYDKSMTFLINASLAYMHYSSDQFAKTGFHSYNQNITGNTMGFSVGIGYDIRLLENVSLGFQVSFIQGALSEFDLNTREKTEVINLKDEKESLNRVDFSVGLKFNI